MVAVAVLIFGLLCLGVIAGLVALAVWAMLRWRRRMAEEGLRAHQGPDGQWYYRPIEPGPPSQPPLDPPYPPPPGPDYFGRP
ncbi:hypothetical protein GCM10010174_88880 [Kutzneria viridogrisea]|uniref:H+/Cl- antiporter ClcA n=1 Tax=Kutzneria viridogrisea TaxID=47990 RepID=A0ABR6BIU3_9PSEU|nr:H+/Cl- antiporter ClcA [Kutzneria viridogrisea]